MLEYLIKGLDYLTQEELHKLKKIIQHALEETYIYESIKICDGHINNGKFDDPKLEHENFIIGLIGKLFIDLARS
jgi:septin family protein